MRVMRAFGVIVHALLTQNIECLIDFCVGNVRATLFDFDSRKFAYFQLGIHLKGRLKYQGSFNLFTRLWFNTRITSNAKIIC